MYSSGDNAYITRPKTPDKKLYRSIYYEKAREIFKDRINQGRRKELAPKDPSNFLKRGDGSKRQRPTQCCKFHDLMIQ